MLEIMYIVGKIKGRSIQNNVGIIPMKKFLYALESITVKIILFYDQNLVDFETLNFMKFFVTKNCLSIFSARKLQNFIKSKYPNSVRFNRISFTISYVRE